MTRKGVNTAFGGLALLSILSATVSCGQSRSDSALSKSEEEEALSINVAPPPENGPRLGSIANVTPIVDRPTLKARSIGALHAGALAARSAQPVRKAKDCEGGFYAIYPRGFVCQSQGATVDLAHPTLSAMAIQPALDQALPYTYGRARTDTALFERDPGRDDAVREVQKLARGSAMAIVGSWTAHTGGGEAERLGLLTNGRFVRARDLEAARGSSFVGYELGEGHSLPVAFVVKRGVSQFKPDGERFTKADPLGFHSTVTLSGRYRTFNGTRLWANSDERWVRDQDVTIVHRRTRFPDFAREGQRWLDVGVLLGTLVMYQGKEPIFATLVSAGRDRPGDTPSTDPPWITKLGTFEVVAKHVTLLGAPPERAGEQYSVFDMPWALELSSGQFIHGAYWHDRFGIEHGSGDVMLSPSDAHRLFEWAAPQLPKSWHSATADDKEKTIVVIHK